MTIVVGLAGAVGAALCVLRARLSWPAVGLIFLFTALQVALVRISFLPAIAHQ